MKIRLIEGREDTGSAGSSVYLSLGRSTVVIEPDSECIAIEARQVEYYFCGAFYYVRTGGGTERLTKGSTADCLRRLLSVYGLDEINDIVEGEYIGIAIDRRSNRIQLCGDMFNRRPLFYSTTSGTFVAGDRLRDVVAACGKRGIDQVSLYNYLLLGYAPGRDTFYAGISKLGADEVLTLSLDGVNVTTKRKPKVTRNYGRDDISRYQQLIENAVESRTSAGMNVVMNSGGWDSTSLVYLLREAIGASNVQSIVFDVRLRGGESFNVYEVDKVKRISDYYGIKSESCVIDYGSAASVDVWERAIPALRDSHTYFWVHHMKLADHVAGYAAPGTAVFSGEAADSIHNFGYSQWVSVNYESMQLREIADKAKSYLYGPTFFSKIQAGSFEEDKIFQFFKYYYGDSRFVETRNLSAEQLVRKYFEAFVLSYPRVPFASWQDESVALPALVREYEERVGRDYFQEAVRDVGPESLYFYLLQFYRAFHFQSAQIGVARVALERHGLACRMPFLDLQMVDFMYSMPENWGRGLELRTTKYPLRYLATERWDMPLHILEEPGPHSYIAENDKKWTYSGGKWDIYCEILFNSAFSDYFRDKLGSFRVEEYFDPRSFNVRAIEEVIKGYRAGKQDVPNHALIFKLALLSSIGLVG